MKKKLFMVIATTALAAMVLSACGSNKDDKSAASMTPMSSMDHSTMVPTESVAPVSAAPVTETGITEEITVTAKNFDFDKKEIHVKKGDKIKLTLVNGSGAHGLEIPDLGVKLATAGTVEFVADQVGEFEYNCALMCGTGHDVMVGKFIVE